MVKYYYLITGPSYTPSPYMDPAQTISSSVSGDSDAPPPQKRCKVSSPEPNESEEEENEEDPFDPESLYSTSSPTKLNLLANLFNQHSDVASPNERDGN